LFAGLALAMSSSFTTAAGPVPGDRSTHKPSAEACAAARRDGRALPGCDQPGLRVSNPASALSGGQGDRSRMVCPQDPRCPR